MSRNKITTTGSSAASLLSTEMLRKLGVDVGDEVDVSIVDRTLILRPFDEVERAQRIIH